ncbi:molybdopterin-guanine dinucleotide biosynthesis protein B [Rhodospirillum rubrum]|uniref:molybdopterin-guanine dinucleotide biosynthesis protein B n=1 Tax=Rhodospirillum rubrum TaxID=1085 RepID=UPI0019035EC5|nr:molybdopterin-guanine dinucleotide biosynthesis protein B [Rhodospirillum rubrum]MBK1664648.1 molybdopterin-guanine dinucleotide biosynthesis protein B [Rhodospirillum rubrum]MBK1676329.1 molybdopterin-guanine dinucleotide biosynthesis protein B [Rhodospirillum rubrum]
MKLFGLTGKSNSGKTTLLIALIPLLQARGLRVSTVKHGHHVAQLDTPGKDSDRHREAGAFETIFSTVNGYSITHGRAEDEGEPTLESLVARLAPVDLVLVEGFKREAIPRLEVFRPAVGKPALYPEDDTILAVASDVAHGPGWPAAAPPLWLALNDPPAIAAFIHGTLFGRE